MEPSRQERHSSTFACLRILVAVTGFCLTGCYSAGDVELLESQLRRQEDAIRGCRGQLNQANEELARAQREIDELHRQLAATQSDSSVMLPEQIHALAQVEDIAVDTWRTGLIDADDSGNVDELLLVLYPRDSDGQAVKVSGELEIEALDLSLPADDQVLGHWSYSAEQAGELWHVGFVSVGYHVEIPLPVTPQGNELLLHAVLTTADGRTFAVTHSLPVRRRSNSDGPITPLESVDEFFEERPLDVDAAPTPLPATSRDVLVPDPADEPHIGIGAATTGYSASTGNESTEPLEEDAASRPGEFNRNRPTETSDNWTGGTIPAWR